MAVPTLGFLIVVLSLTIEGLVRCWAELLLMVALAKPALESPRVRLPCSVLLLSLDVVVEEHYLGPNEIIRALPIINLLVP